MLKQKEIEKNSASAEAQSIGMFLSFTEHIWSFQYTLIYMRRKQLSPCSSYYSNEAKSKNNKTKERKKQNRMDFHPSGVETGAYPLQEDAW